MMKPAEELEHGAQQDKQTGGRGINSAAENNTLAKNGCRTREYLLQEDRCDGWLVAGG